MGKLFRSDNGTFILPGILSALIPGLGQLVKKQTGKAIFFFAIWMGWFLVTWVFSLIPILGGLAGWLIGIFLWFVNVLDAYLNGDTR